jgi:hypothetical protein
MIKEIWNRAKYRIVPVVCLVMAVLASSDTFPEYNWIRYGFIVAGVLSIFIGGHNSILKGIAVLEILISFAVVFEKTNKAENLIEAKKIARLEKTLVNEEDCSIYKNQWALRDCSVRNAPHKQHNKVVNEKIANLKTNVPTIKVLQADPSLLAFIIFSCALPWLSFLSAKKIEIEKEIVIEEKIIEKEIEKLVEVPVEKIVFQKTNLIQFVRDLFSDKTDLSISEQYEIDRRTVKGLRVQYSNKKYMQRTQNVQSMSNVINLEERKKA